MTSFVPRRLLTAANLMTLARLPMAALVWVAPASVPWVGAWLVLAGLSDLADGWLARREGVHAEDLGAWLDPLCDKVFVVSTLLAVWTAFSPAWWLAALAATRELVLLPLVLARFIVPSLRAARVPWKALPLGKATTVAQFTLFLAVLLQVPAGLTPLAVLAALLGLAAGVQYAARAVRVLRSAPR